MTERYVVTGGLGFIGSHLVDLILEMGHDVTVIDDERSSVIEDIAGAEVIRLPVDQWWFPDDGKPYSGIFHLAGPVGPVGVLEHAGRIATSIIDTADYVRGIAMAENMPLVYISTSEIYGEQQQPVCEADSRVIAPGASARMEYAVGKLAAETMLLNTFGLGVTIIRPFNVAGPRQSERGGFVLPRFLRQARSGDPMTVYQPGSQRRAFTHVKDIAAGIWAGMVRGERKVAYNLGNPDNACSILTLAEEVREACGSSSRIDIIDPVSLWGSSFAEAPDKIPDIELATRYLGWEPRYNRQQIIRELVSSAA